MRPARALRVLTAPFVSGQYFTRWSLLLAFTVGTFLSVPSVGDASFVGYLRGVAVAAAGSPPLILLGLGAAWAERRVASAAVRAAVVVATLGAVSAGRPFLNDAVSTTLFGVSTGANWPTRIATNIVTCTVLFTVCAVAVTYHRRLRATTLRLRLAGARMRAGIADAARSRDESAATLRDVADDLRDTRDRMLAGTVDYDSVSAYSARVRDASHRVDTLVATPHAPAADLAVGGSQRIPVLGRLGTTPPLTVGLTYVAATLPFGLAHGGPSVAVAAVLACAALDLAAGALNRAARPAPPRLRGLVFLATWLVAGFGVLALTYALVPDVGALGLVPLVGVPLIAVVISLSVDAYRRARAEEARATAVLRESARTLAAAVEAARAPMRRATDLLHGRLQGRCVILAAHADEHTPDDATLAGFRAQTDEILDEVRSAATVATTGESVDDLVDAWSVALDVDLAVSPDARDALALPSLGDAAAALVNEGLVNAVKHSGARAARIDIDRVAARLTVQIRSAGELATEALTSGLGTRAAHTTIRQDGDDVVLRGVFDVPASLGQAR
ncbi:hypothetical protein KZX37_00315 [Microbacterium sp. EYE_5]|uniref:hypothetical protein n=1 Tax=unclassified Microbacterium TaxID=2609290 RepID=UPI0020057B85|nr:MULTISPECIES: hypothetical protein [unclassified Microbacterium]MCK6079056.1 hypothetical protein [Microbacterium sp. EYE_382]MCK6084326.1 hypothetical protein [Microbacterium sp. EYE_384]MCK6123445.1 hypothetical protein [Microbacterium sp. EYE_80]MCK6125090.1 hypothetical protein [Microbacterium sp. EYE_79]MCK6140010.1 hypothetical protein [Microbacterium sp. EYE_39]